MNVVVILIFEASPVGRSAMRTVAYSPDEIISTLEARPSAFEQGLDDFPL